MVKFICKRCGEVEIPKRKRKKGKFCSLECYQKYRSENQQNFNFVCKNCGKNFIDYGHSDREFCSRRCNSEYQKKSFRREITYDIDPESGCWVCTSHAGIHEKDYPRITIEGKHVLLHRYMYEQKYGKIPDGMDACHECDNPRCINPDHIFLGKHKDNMEDRNNKGRSNSLKGSAVLNSKLTDDDVRYIRQHKEISARVIAKQFKVCKTTIDNVRQKLTYKNVI